ncbi:prepilin peptidase [Tenacibaculum vairaonense]|uniref:Prepilin type IV endopeptidase peptidase domain-containing protein n=1 Tax=Tenacibaculum vairaonense TaxID=3137860 RepID=A0ABP1FE15_9FLAO
MIYIYLILLLIIFYQDSKERKVSAWVLITTIVLGGTIYYLNTLPSVFILNVSTNIGFILIIIGILHLYSKFKMKKKINEGIGLGDVLFFITLAVSFPITSFLILLSLSLVFSLLLFLIVKPNLQQKVAPLAGLQALFLFIILFINLTFNFVNLYAL